MKLLSGVITILLINTLASCSTVVAQNNEAGSNNEPVKEESDSTKSESGPGTEPKPAPKPADSAPEPGCS